MIELFCKQNDLKLKLEAKGFENADEDWVNISLKLTQGDNIFRQTDPCLELDDFLSIIEWFRALEQNKLPSTPNLRFLEPEISFHYIVSSERSALISVFLDYRFEPDFTVKQSHPWEYDQGDKIFDVLLEMGFEDSEIFGNQHIFFDLKSKDFKRIRSGFETAKNILSIEKI